MTHANRLNRGVTNPYLQLLRLVSQMTYTDMDKATVPVLENGDGHPAGPS